MKSSGESVFKFGNLFESKAGVFMYFGQVDVLTDSRIKNMKTSDLNFDENDIVSCNIAPENKHMCFHVGVDFESLFSEKNEFTRDLNYGFTPLPTNALFKDKTIHDLDEVTQNKSVKKFIKSLIDSKIKFVAPKVKPSWKVQDRVYSYELKKAVEPVVHGLSAWIDTKKEKSFVLIYKDFRMFEIHISGMDKTNNGVLSLYQICKGEKKFFNSINITSDDVAYDSRVHNVLNKLFVKEVTITEFIDLEIVSYKNIKEVVKIKI